MKTLLKTLLLCAALAVMSGCSAQRRAERHVRKAVELCPELVQVKAHLVDTFFTAPGFADCTILSLPEVLKGDTLYAATDHGTVIVSLQPTPTDTVLRVGFVAAPRKIHLQDTVHYAQVVVSPKPHLRESAIDWGDFLVGMLCFVVGMAAAFYLLLNKKS